jgi:nucleotide-binding universal stress UspA family protein
MFAKIIVPLDGSKAAETVLPYLEEIAAKFGSEIFLVSVSRSSTPDIEHLYQGYLEGFGNQLQRDLQKYVLKKETSILSKFLNGEPAKEIIRYASENQADLILMASRGSSGQSPWVLGNIAAKVLRASAQPVLLIGAAPAGSPEKGLIKKILVPLDGSEIGAAAIPYVEALAAALQAEIVLFQAIVLTEMPSLYGNATYSISPSGLEEMKNSAQAYLERIAWPLKEKGLKTSVAIQWASPADAIVDYAQANDIDLIAMSTHGRTGIGRWVFGSVTDKVLHAGAAAVLVVRASRA